jgi:MtaA/CmuA family methyltransferase
MTMTSKERVFATMNFEPVDRPAVFPLEGSAWVCKKNGLSYDDMFALPDLGAQLLVDGFKEMKSDAIYVGGSVWMAWTHAFGSPVDASGVGAPINVEPVFKNPEEEIPELTYDEIREKLLADHYVQCALNQVKAVKEIVGDEYPLMTGHDGPMTACGVLVGMEDIMLALGMRKPWVPKLMDFAVLCLAVYADLMVEYGTDIINLCDPVSSGDMISPIMFKKNVVPALKKYKELKKHPETPVLVHICGKAGARTEAVRDFGAKFFSVDSMVDLADCVQKCDGRMVMVGNINPAEVMLQGTTEQVYENAMQILETAAENGGRAIPCTGCELPCDSPLENIQAMARAAEDFAAR